MKPALPHAVVALALFACGGGSSSATSKAGTSNSKPSTADAKAGSKTAAAGEAADLDPESAGVNEMMKVLDGLPTQDELDAAAAARITEATADSEYEKLKAEIEGDLNNLGTEKVEPPK